MPDNIPLYKDKTKSFEDRVEDLLSRMSLPEKVAQLQCIRSQKSEFICEDDNSIDLERLAEFLSNGIGQIGRLSENQNAKQMAIATNQIQKCLVGNTSWGIPAMLHEEGLHGMMADQCISFPQPIAVACSWNPELAQKTYEHTARELRVRGSHHVFTPVLDVARDARWGRVEETFGEDPYLVSEMGLAAVKGFQGDVSEKLSEDKVMACLKHFAVHGQPESGTNCAPANYSERVIREVFLYPFKKVIEQAGALSVMPSYNEIDGIPSHKNKWLIQDVLRGEMGFNGFVISDYFAIQELENRHHVVADTDEAGIEALQTGVDVETPDPVAYANLAALVSEGRLDEELINQSVRRVLYYKFFSGLFDNPYVDPEKAEAFVSDKSHRKLAYDIAAESAVLLQNKNDILPFDFSSVKRVAVIGPNGNCSLNGGYPGTPVDDVTVLAGIKDRFGAEVEVVFAEGCKITKEGDWFEDPVELSDEAEDRKLLSEAIELAKTADVVLLAIGGNELSCREGWGEEHLGDRARLEMVGLQNELLDGIYELRKPIIALLFHGRPLAIQNVVEKADAILDCWYLGQETGYVVADVLSGAVNPSGKLPISYPRSAGHIPCFYNYKPSARRGYLFDEISPLFSFGFGLSYSSFVYGNPVLSKAEMMPDGKSILSIEVSNTSDCPGKEVVQLYVRDDVSKITRPVKELKAFEKIQLDAGESKTVEFEIGREQLEYYGEDMSLVVEPGEFTLLVGSSSVDTDLKEVKLLVK